jgi:hypothetical protein|tara:strand:- start:260 stop:613 length:354 start_codon:yes stop_codon:yes gene_type:complete
MKKRELNKKLKSRLLHVKNGKYIKHGVVRVVRAREIITCLGDIQTSVDIRVSAIIRSTTDNWLPVTSFSPRGVRKFLRQRHNNVPNTVNSWTKLWGVHSDSNITISNIELVVNPCTV